jgi:hypothetical protein
MWRWRTLPAQASPISSAASSNHTGKSLILPRFRSSSNSIIASSSTHSLPMEPVDRSARNHRAAESTDLDELHPTEVSLPEVCRAETRLHLARLPKVRSAEVRPNIRMFPPHRFHTLTPFRRMRSCSPSAISACRPCPSIFSTQSPDTTPFMCSQKFPIVA